MSNSLSKIDNPWLRIIAGASASFATVTIVSAVVIGLAAPQNKSANKIAVYATLLATAAGAVWGFVAADESLKNDAVDANQTKTTTKKEDAWQDWHNFEVVRKVPESKEITSFYLQPQDGGKIVDFKPGQFLTIKLDIPEKERPVIRTYSISDYPQGSEYYRLSIKKEGAPKDLDVPPGVASTFMHDRVSEGTVIPCKPPKGMFFADPDSSVPVVLMSNGVGITPMISMAKACSRSNPQRHIWFLHGARNGEYHAFCEEIKELAESAPNLHLHYRYSRPQAEDQGKYHSEGYVDKQLLEELVIPEISKIYGSGDAEYFLCGSPSFMDSIRQALGELGVAEEKVYFESFSGGKTKGKTAAGKTQEGIERAEVSFERSQQNFTWTQDDGTLLEFAEANNLNPDYSCRQGICLTCMCQLKSGEVEYVEPPTNDPDPGAVLICISKPKSAKVVLDL